ncbi:MAG TPA: hypothetical protein PLP57_00985 [Candidatus Saccharicenans sp.]|nr:hypothetical protein [Candidatus Saccharicenans sp.]
MLTVLKPFGRRAIARVIKILQAEIYCHLGRLKARSDRVTFCLFSNLPVYLLARKLLIDKLIDSSRSKFTL